MKLTLLIADDAPQARRLLRLVLQEYLPDVEVLGEAKDGAEALELTQKFAPDVLLLDIEMPEKSGLQVAEELATLHLACQIIFTTAYSEYAVQAFRLSAIDYLLKPIQETDLMEALNKAKEKKNNLLNQKRLEVLAKNLQMDSPKTLCLPVLNGHEYVDVPQIEYIEAEGSYVNICLAVGKKILISKNLKYFETLLEPFDYFLRPHRSFLVNKNHIKTIKTSSIILQSMREIDLSKERRKEFLEILKREKYEC